MIEPRAMYIDPAVGSYIIMSIASIAVPIGAVIVMMWRDIKGKIIKAFNLEDKFITETEGKVEIIEPLDEAHEATETTQTTNASISQPNPQNKSV